MRTPDPTCYFEIHSVRERNPSPNVTATARWRRHYVEYIKCPNCPMPGRSWQERPEAIPIEVSALPQGVTSFVGDAPFNLFHTDLLDALGDHLPTEMLWADCLCAVSSHGRDRSVYKYGLISWHRGVWTGRGEPSPTPYRRCDGCGRIFGPRDSAIVARQVHGRRLVADAYGSLLIRGDLAAELDLVRRFPDLRLFKIPVVDEPKDRWVLPGDSHWKGELIASPFRYYACVRLNLAGWGRTPRGRAWLRSFERDVQAALARNDGGVILHAKTAAGIRWLAYLGRDENLVMAAILPGLRSCPEPRALLGIEGQRLGTDAEPTPVDIEVPE
ncbi:MAG: hypothetical protein KIT68_11950 [Phycisphaeraceae bacterium]|nr:hypothetical protein [Phycisphaeraceae bacterium]